MYRTHCSHFINELFPISFEIIKELYYNKNFIRELSFINYSIIALTQFVLEIIFDLFNIS